MACFLWKPSKPIEVHVGIDLGTEFTGIAFSVKGSKEIIVIDNWPGSGGRTPKVPSTISHDAPNRLWGRKTVWGFKINGVSDEKVYRSVKLLVDDKDTDFGPAVTSRLLLKEVDRRPSAVMGDYLKLVMQYVNSVLRKRLGRAARNMEVHYSLTVPDGSTQGMYATRDAAYGAEINEVGQNITYITESEAALMDCFYVPDSDIKRENGVVLLVDAGYRKVSVGAYKMSSDIPASFEEGVPGSLKGVVEESTGFCASAMLDDNFEKLLIKLFGYKEYVNLPEKTRQAAMRHWQDSIKPSFGCNQHKGGEKNDPGLQSECDVTYLVPMPGVQDDLSVGLERGFLLIDKAQVQGIFDPVIEDLKGLLAAQFDRVADINQEIKVIALVGGFGSSKYLSQQLEVAYPHIKVLQRPDAWASAARGAAVRSLTKPRMARRHYGVTYTAAYDPEIHRIEDAYWDSLQEMYRVPHQMEWLIKKGEAIVENKAKSASFYHTYKIDKERKGHHCLYACDKDKAPEVWREGDVYKICRYPVNFDDAPKRALVKARNSKGVEYYKVSFKTYLIPMSTKLILQDDCNYVPAGNAETDY